MSSITTTPGRPHLPGDPAVIVARRYEDVVVGNEISRHNLLSRISHWAVAITFVLATLTGMPIWTPVFGWMAYLFGGLTVCRLLHPWLGVAFVVFSIERFFQWVSDMHILEPDVDWFRQRATKQGRAGVDDSRVGKYNGGQKLYFWAVSLGCFGFLLSGLVMWLPQYFSPIVRQLAYLLHDFTFICFAVSLVIHIFLSTAAEPGTFVSMSRGTVTRAWARLHHPRWYHDVLSGVRSREVIQNEPPRKT
jgi:formate dehydrogenase subunit gamma